MSDVRWNRLRELYEEAQQLPQAERGAYLDREVADDADLRAEVHELLDADATAGGFLAASSAEPDYGSIGPYRLLEVLGEGGFGVVYLAEQEKPLHRRVALKLIKLGMDTQLVIRRFEAERQALALMDHPGIAQVFDAGQSETGRLYFAMEYVPGKPITAFCDQRKLRIRERLELFLQVCDAVQHAHQKGIIHRDIKPSNLLVAVRDGTPVPKVIDFGIVKATSAPETDATLMTREGMIVGTLGYMSPEQAGGTAGVDTRTDIYSLGVVLYELLAGAAPFDPKRLREAALSDALRVIREEEPPTLAACLTRSGEAIAEVAQRRSTDQHRLFRELRGELEWITLRALEKLPDRRYASAAELGADIRRHMANEPVLAGPPSTMYRVRKYARRHRGRVITAGVVTAAIVAGGVVAAIGFQRAVRSEVVARREAESSKRVTDFLVDLFAVPDPDRSMGETVTARTLLDIGARRIQGEAIQDPSVRARLLSTMGSAYYSLGLRDEGVQLTRQAADATQRASGPQSAALGTTLSELGYELGEAGKGEEVDSLLQRSIGILSHTEGAKRGPLPMALLRQAQWRFNSGRGAEGDSLATVATAMLEGEARPDTAVLVNAYSMRGFGAGWRFQEKEQEKYDLRALQLATAFFGERNTRVLRLHRKLASVYSKLCLPDSALRHADEAVRLTKEMFPDDHPAMAQAMFARGDALMGAHRAAEAAVAYEDALKRFRASYPPDHQYVENSLFSLGGCYEAERRFDLAIDRVREAYEIDVKALGPDNEITANRLRVLANLCATVGRLNEADALYVTAIHALSHEESSEGALALTGLANVRRDRGKLGEADSLYGRAEAAYDTTSTELRLYFGDSLTQHGYLRSLQGRHAEAESMIRTGIEVQLRDDSADSPEMLDAYLRWAAARARARNVDGAIEALRKAVPCGGTVKDIARYPEIIALRTHAGFPFHGSP